MKRIGNAWVIRTLAALDELHVIHNRRLVLQSKPKPSSKQRFELFFTHASACSVGRTVTNCVQL